MSIDRNQGFIIDWLAFTITSDSQSEKPQTPSLEFVYRFLNLEASDFSSIGGGNRYAERYTSNNITVSVAPEGRFDDMGIHVSMTAQGLRYYEQVQKDGEIIANSNLWREFFIRLRELNELGYAVKPSRIDIAKDDYDGVIDMTEIERCARQGEFVSRFKTAHKITIIEGLTDKDKGHSVTFGSRQSNTYLRFYDKKAEQLSKCKDKERKQELESLEHWNRMEFEFKDSNAVKIINLICDSDNFGLSFAEICNGYIRFVNLDCQSNKSMCKMKKWWSDFMETMEKSRLTVSKYISYSAKKMKSYFDRCLAPTIYTVMATNGMDEVMLSIKSAENRLKTKHIDIINGANFEGASCFQQLWEALNPIPAQNRVEYVC